MSNDDSALIKSRDFVIRLFLWILNTLSISLSHRQTHNSIDDNSLSN